ncbi:MAG: dihydroneopterin aldolase [Acidimicrobiales bacterium]
MNASAARDGGDRVELRKLRVDAVHGLLDEERTAPQPFEVDLDLYLDLATAGSADDLSATADYAAAVDAAVAVLRGPPVALLETLAAEIATAVLGGGRVLAVTVSVRKLRPPVPHQLGSAGVRITRGRP